MRNAFEKKVATKLGSEWAYEDMKLSYTTTHSYTPDFVNYETKTIIESKGFFRAADRAKMKAVKAQNPDWTYVLIFQNPDKTIAKNSRTTYRQWAEKNGFQVRSV